MDFPAFLDGDRRVDKVSDSFKFGVGLHRDVEKPWPHFTFAVRLTDMRTGFFKVSGIVGGSCLGLYGAQFLVEYRLLFFNYVLSKVRYFVKNFFLYVTVIFQIFRQSCICVACRLIIWKWLLEVVAVVEAFCSRTVDFDFIFCKLCFQ